MLRFAELESMFARAYNSVLLGDRDQMALVDQIMFAIWKNENESNGCTNYAGTWQAEYDLLKAVGDKRTAAEAARFERLSERLVLCQFCALAASVPYYDRGQPQPKAPRNRTQQLQDLLTWAAANIVQYGWHWHRIRRSEKILAQLQRVYYLTYYVAGLLQLLRRVPTTGVHKHVLAIVNRLPDSSDWVAATNSADVGRACLDAASWLALYESRLSPSRRTIYHMEMYELRRLACHNGRQQRTALPIGNAVLPMREHITKPPLRRLFATEGGD